MKSTCCLLLSSVIAAMAPTHVNAQTTPLSSAFTYQGDLQSGGVRYTGSADFRLTLYNNAMTGAPVAAALTRSNISVVDGKFTLDSLDFGLPPFASAVTLWIGLEVRTPHDPANAAAFTLLSPRQVLTSSPFSNYAILAGAAANANTLGGFSSSHYHDASNLSVGFLPGARLAGNYTNSLTLSNPGNVITGSFSGSGALLAGLNASNLATGTVADARLSLNIPRLDAASNQFSGSLSIGQLGSNPFSIIAPGTATGGAPGFNEVVGRVRNTSAGHTAFSIDGGLNQDGILYFAENGGPVWGLRNDADQNDEFQLRLHNAGQNLTLWGIDTQGNMGVGVRPSTGARLTVSGLIATTAGGGVVFPDGTVQRTAAGASIAARPLATYPANTVFSIMLGTARCRLGSPINISVDVIEGAGGGAGFTTASPGQVIRSGFQLSRTRTTDNDWLSLWNNVVANGWNTAGQTLTITRTQTGVANAVTLTIPGMQVSGYMVRPNGTGGLDEVLFVEPEVAVNFMPSYASGGFSTGALTELTELSAVLSGVATNALEPVMLMRIASVAEFTGQPPSADISQVIVPRFTFRAPFGANLGLRDWMHSVLQGGSTRRTLTISSGGSTLYTSGNSRAFPYLYRIAQAPDGSIYEEYELAADAEP